MQGGTGLRKIEKAGKQDAEEPKLDHEFEKTLVRAIRAAKPGSCEQRDLVARLERWCC
jgi:hypothetical protein